MPGKDYQKLYEEQRGINKNLLSQLENAENWIKDLEMELEDKMFNFEDYQNFAKGQIKIKDKAIKLASEQLSEKDQKLTRLKSQKEGWENQASYLTEVLLKIATQRDNYQQDLEKTIYQLEQEQLNNQIAYEFLNSLAYERDTLVHKYKLAKGKIERRETRISEYEKKLREARKIISQSKTEIQTWKDKYWNLDIKFNKAQRKNESEKLILKNKITLYEQQLDSNQKELAKKHKKILKLQRENQETYSWYEKELNEKEKLHKKYKTQTQNARNLAQSRQDLEKKLAKANQKIESLEGDVYDLERRYELKDSKWKRARKKLEELKTQQKDLSQVAQDKQVCMSLIKYEGLPRNADNLIVNDKLNKAINETTTSLIDTISTAQTHLGITDLTKLVSDYKMPRGTTLKDLINFYNSPPQTTPHTQYVEVPKEVIREVEVEKPVIRIKDKVIEVESEIQKNKIKDLERIIIQLEQKLKNQPTKTIYQQSKLKKWWWLLIILLAIKGAIIIILTIKNKSIKKLSKTKK